MHLPLSSSACFPLRASQFPIFPPAIPPCLCPVSLSLSTNVRQCSMKWPVAVTSRKNKLSESGFPKSFFSGSSAFCWPTWQGKSCHASPAFKANGLTLTLQDGVGLGTTCFENIIQLIPECRVAAVDQGGGGSVTFFPAVAYPNLFKNKRPKTNDYLSHV